MTMDSEEADRKTVGDGQTDGEGQRQLDGRTDDRQTRESDFFRRVFCACSALRRCSKFFMFCLLLLLLLVFARLLPVLIPPTDHWAEII